ncbi:MAG: glucose-1-phosphate adenylyltransferase subunit GlgD, partial [Oscillospiraceae bacterium]
LDLIDKDSIAALCKQFPIYTKIRDDAPVRYAIGSNVKKIIAGDGCYIEGTVENSVLFRGVKIGKGAVVKNCVLLQDTEVMDGAVLENVICDKGVRITAGKMLIGAQNHPVYIDKKAVV